MSNFRSIPLTLTGSGADMRRITDAEELVLAINAEYSTVLSHSASNLGNHASNGVSRNYHGSLDRYGTRVADSDMVQIGTFTDTFYNQAVGTHPGTSLNSSVTTTPLFQCYDSSSSVDYLNFPNTTGAQRARLIALDSDGDFRELDSAQTIAFGKRLLETSLSNEYVGAWRIGSSTPGNGIWEKWNNNAFTDTTSTASTNYNVYRKISNSPADATTANASKIMMGLRDSADSINVGSQDIQELGYANAYAMSTATQLARINSELGKMVLLPSTQTPASTGETGTWQTRGTAVDTINTTENINYTSEYFTSISRTEPFTGSRQFVNRGSDQYTRFRFLDVADDFGGQREAPYAGHRTNQQNGRNEQFGGQRFSSAQYAGNRQFATQFLGTRPYAGTRPNAEDFAGTRPYAGQTTFILKSSEQFLGNRNYDESFAGFRVTQGTANYGSQRDFAGYAGGARQGRYSKYVLQGDWAGTRYNNMQSQLHPQYKQYQPFVGGRYEYRPMVYDFTGVRYHGEPWNQVIYFARTPVDFYNPGDFAGLRSPGGLAPQIGVPYGGERFVSSSIRYYQRISGDQPWAGQRFANIQRISGDQPWAGKRWNPVTRYAGIDTPDTYIGDRQFGKQFIGNRDDDFSGIRDENYIGQYTGQYTEPYTRNYIGQFSTQYAGETLTNLASTLETYTLYCKVSES